MSCNVSSIALSCLQLLADQEDMWGSYQQNHSCNCVTVPQWLDEILSDGYPDESTSNTLEAILMDSNLFVNCTIPYDGGDKVLECTEVNLFI